MPRRPRFRTVAIFILLVAALGTLALVTVARAAPRSDRDWSADHATPARVTLGADEVRIENLRDFRHEPGGTFTEHYRDETFALPEVTGVWFVLAPFAERWRGLAHAFVSFELTGDRFVAVSIEARREEAESYSLVKGLLRGFEVAYVVGVEEDLIGLRALRGDTLFLYRSRATPAQAREMFADMLTRVEALHTHPEFYNTLTNNCVTLLREHVNKVATEPLPFGWGVLFPGYSDELALEHGLLDTELPIDEARRRHRVEERARRALSAGLTGSDFSREIRSGG